MLESPGMAGGGGEAVVHKRDVAEHSNKQGLVWSYGRYFRAAGGLQLEGRTSLTRVLILWV